MQLENNLYQDEKAFPEEHKGNTRIFHTKSHCRLDELLCIGTSDSLATFYTCKTKKVPVLFY